MSMTVKVQTKGNFFSIGADTRVKKGVVNMVRRLTEAGQARLAQVLRKRPEGVYLEDGKSTGNYRRNVKSTLVEGGLGALITDGGVIYGPWLEGVSSRNDVTRFKGYAAFRKTGQYLNEIAPTLITEEAKLIVRELS